MFYNLEMKKSKLNIKFRKITVVVVLVQVFLYTWMHLFLSAMAGIEIAPTTSVAFYSFCGAEAGLLAWLKKLDKQTDKELNETEETPYERDFNSETDEP